MAGDRSGAGRGTVPVTAGSLRIPAPTGTTSLAAVIGDPIAHSRSPAIHNAAFAATGLDWVYVAFRVPAGGGGTAVAAMRALGIRGMSVTMPLKEEVAAAVDRLEPPADVLGAVNCLWWDGPTLVGSATDGPGFVDAMEAAGHPVAGRRVLVVGAGGAARAVIAACASAGAASVTVIGRTPPRVAAAAALAGGAGRVGDPSDVSASDIVVNATPVGMGGDPRIPVDPELLGSHQVVVDLIYEPRRTPLLEAAAARGCPTVDGLGMLVHQAAHQFVRWTGRDAPLDVMLAAVGS